MSATHEPETFVKPFQPDCHFSLTTFHAFSPDGWHDVTEDKLIATGTYEIGASTGGNQYTPPPYNGSEDGEITTFVSYSYTPRTYTREYREFRLRRSTDGDPDMPLAMNFVRSDNNPGGEVVEDYGETLSMVSGANLSGGTITCDGTTTTPNTTRTVAVPSIGIVPDSSMYDPVTGVGLLGDEVPSAYSASTQKHFVTPKQTPEISAPYVVLQALGVTAADFEAVPPAQPRMSWLGGAPLSTDKTKCRVSRATAGHTTVILKPKNGVGAVMNVWVVSATITATSIPWAETVVGTGGLSLTGGYDFKHAILPPEIITTAEHPNLAGPNAVILEGGGATSCGDSLIPGADHKWDNSRQIRGKFFAPPGFTPDCHDQLNATYPGDPLVGDDDPHNIFDETNDPYTNANHVLTGKDSPTRGWLGTKGANGDKVEHRLQFQEFTRLEINRKWYRISEMFPWRAHLKFKKVNDAWINNTSIKATDNAEWEAAP